jgi:hypothetical protein
VYALMITARYTLDDIIELADQERWSPAGSHPGGSGVPPQVYWTTADGRTHVTWIEDTLVRLPWVQLDGPDEAAVAASLVARVEAVPPDEALAAWEGATDDLGREIALGWATLLAARGPDPRVLAVFRAAMSHSRDLALLATKWCSRAAWPETLALLDEVAASHADADVRGNAVAIGGWMRKRVSASPGAR